MKITCVGRYLDKRVDTIFIGGENFHYEPTILIPQ